MPSTYTPGKTIQDVVRVYGIKPEHVIKLGSNENPLGPSPKAAEAITKHLNEISVYPSPAYTELKNAIAGYIGASASRIAVGNGSDDVLNTLLKSLLSPGNEVIIPVPTYSYYEAIAEACGGSCIFVDRNADFSVNVRNILDAITKQTKMVFICSPNNPTGNIVEKDPLVDLLQSTACFILLDEAYAEFSSENYTTLTSDFDNLIVLRTCSKAFGLAGVRLGYAIVNESIANEYDQIRLAFTVNQLAVWAGIAAFSDAEFLQRTLALVKDGRQYLMEHLPFKVYPSEANFVFVDVTPYTSSEIAEYLMRNGIIVRDCSTFRGCGNNSIRITVGHAWQNARLVSVLKKFLATK